jgi:peptidoglycan/LPS O-acetylase OafA/YrhL
VLALAGFLAVASSPGDPEGTPGAWDFLRYGIPAALFVGAATMGPQLPDTTLVRWGVLLGDASYALYLVHPFVIRPLREVWRLAPVEWLSQIPYCLVCVPIAIAVALALHLLVEKPLGKWLTGLTRRPSAATRPARAEA